VSEWACGWVSEWMGECVLALNSTHRKARHSALSLFTVSMSCHQAESRELQPCVW
jgi:hypothetical protein